MNQIALRMNVDHEAVRQILKGTYDIEKSQKAKHRPSKFNWKKIDIDCVSKLPSLIEQLKSQGYKCITKKLVAQELGLKDASLRNLTKLKKLIKEANATSS
jgi:hypothetical protein